MIIGNVQRRGGAVLVYDLTNSQQVARWNFSNGWPSKWEGPHFDAKGKDVAIETLTITHEGLTRPAVKQV